MGMKTSAVWADGTFESNTAPLMGPLEDCARWAAELGYDALSLTVNRPGELDAAYVRQTTTTPVHLFIIPFQHAGEDIKYSRPHV